MFILQNSNVKSKQKYDIHTDFTHLHFNVIVLPAQVKP